MAPLFFPLIFAAAFPGTQLLQTTHVATPLTRVNEFTKGIEGPACYEGAVYAVNFQKQQTIGKVTLQGKGEVFLTLPGKSTGNGIRFDKKGNMYIADYVGHNIYKYNMKTKKLVVHAHEEKMNQPNDLTILPDGSLYASDPNWKNKTGQVWHIDPQGKVTLVAKKMGTTNGIEVSPDGKILYVNESAQRNIWKFDIQKDGTLTNKCLFKKFDDFGFDGMRADIKGNLYIARYGKGTVVKLSPEGKVLQEFDVLGKKPSNVCFGGKDGKTIFVTEVEHRRLVQFRVNEPGATWTSLQK